MPGGGGKGAYSWEFLVGMCGPVLQILDPISDQKMLFSTYVFRAGLKAEIILLLRLQRKQKNISNAFRIRIRSYSFGIEDN